MVYRGITGWQSFEPWLSRIESLSPDRAWEAAESLPPEWYEGQADVLEKLVEQLLERRSRVRDLITAFRNSSRQPFPNWNGVGVSVGSGQFPRPDWGDSVSGRVQ